MKLKTTYKDIQFIIEILIDSNYQEPPTQHLDDEEADLLESQEISYHMLKLQLDLDEQTPVANCFCCYGLLFSNDQEEMLVELEDYLYDGGILDEIIQKREEYLQENISLPPWALKQD